jgi:hypothetical protein
VYIFLILIIEVLYHKKNNKKSIMLAFQGPGNPLSGRYMPRIAIIVMPGIPNGSSAPHIGFTFKQFFNLKYCGIKP